MSSSVVFLLLLGPLCIFGRKGFGPSDQEWGYIEVRPGCFMFWWLYFTTSSTEESYFSKPLVIWIQGGPGGSGTGVGNFRELGPLDIHGNQRDYAWTNNYNVLFVDNPIGVGFSYKHDNATFANNNRKIAEDFVVFLQGFFEKFPKFNNRSYFIFGESYAGRMVPEMALLIHRAQEEGKLQPKLKAIGLGNPWTSPLDLTLTWGTFVHNLGFIDDRALQSLKDIGEKVTDAFMKEEYYQAREQWAKMQYKIQSSANSIYFYNVLRKKECTECDEDEDEEKVDDKKILNKLMNDQVKVALGLEHNWKEHSSEVWNSLKDDFMRSTTQIVEQLLNSTDIEVVIFSGHLDIICDIIGTNRWIQNLKWEGAKKFEELLHHEIYMDGFIEGFFKNVSRLTFYTVLRAGHEVPLDNPKAMKFILKNTIGE